MILWSEPPPHRAALIARASGLGACVLVGAVAATVANWDVTLIAAVLAAALGVDAWRDLRPRELVVAGPDLLVVRTRRRTTTVPREAVADIRTVHRRLRAPRTELVRHDGDPVVLPADVPVDTVREWVDRTDDT